MINSLIGKRIPIPGQFVEAVTVERAEEVGDQILLTVRTAAGDLYEAFLRMEDAKAILAQQEVGPTIVKAESLFLFIESVRIKTAFEYDPHFAVSLSGVRPLPHQLEAVYQRILPQARLRFLLADDPGAGKTIMAGLLVKELKLRGVIERVLILAPAPLTIQWQDELKGKFAETYEVVNSVLAKNQLAGNPWERFRQCIASIDFAKRDEIMPGILQVDWDLVIIDEAHKCSASNQGDEVRRTARYKLAEGLSKISDRLLLLTATPHQGDSSKFDNFLRLLDSDQFISKSYNREMLQLQNSPWFLRRVKEELKDFNGQLLFKKRQAITVKFELSEKEKDLYDKVTDYINKYLGRTTGKKKAPIALARTVLQRRLASSLNAIFSSLKNREKKLVKLLEKLKNLTTKEQKKFLINAGISVDSEADSGDFTEEELEKIAAESTVAERIEQLKEEIQKLQELIKLTQETIDWGTERKLNKLKELLQETEFKELKSGEGKLLIFTEHRDTLDYLKKNLEAWGYTTCQVHGGMSAVNRKKAQEDFQFNKQICIATEAAGEGINLQFCRLMINYDIPWNPNRLEQRMGRIHRIGQKRDVCVFNFVADKTVEGRVLEKLLEKLEEIRKAMGGDRVFDVIGQLLQFSEIRFEELVREASYSKDDENEALRQIEGLSWERLRELEEATNSALATSHIDLSQVQKTKGQGYQSEEQRLMPRYVEEFFKRSCEYLGVNLDVRADGLWRIDYLKEEFRSNDLEAVKNLGTPKKDYKKLTFYKERLEEPPHQDADFLSPGHCLFAAIAERLDKSLEQELGNRSANFIDADATSPYRVHFFRVDVRGENQRKTELTLKAKLFAVAEDGTSGEYSLSATDCLHNLASGDSFKVTPTLEPLSSQEQSSIEKWLKLEVQLKMMEDVRGERQRQLQIKRDYLEKAMNAEIKEARSTQMGLAAKVAGGDDSYRVARDSARNKCRSLEERLKEKRKQLEYLDIVRLGRVTYLGTALVYPAPGEFAGVGMGGDPEVEAIAMEYVMNYERERGWMPEDVSQNRDGSGFDIRSAGPVNAETGIEEVRRIEVKGRAGFEGQVSLTANEWRKAQHLGDTYWLYVLWGCKTPTPKLSMVCNPAKNLAGSVKEVKQVTRYLIDAESIEQLTINN